MIQLQKIANKKSKAIRIELGDIEQHFRGDPAFVERVKINTKRYVTLINDIIDTKMPERNEELEEGYEEPISSILYRQRKENIEANAVKMAQDNIRNKDPYNVLPSELGREYELHIIRGPNEKQNYLKMRDIHSDTIGNLVRFKGIITKASEIRPSIEVACYSCEACGNEAYQLIHGREFNPLAE